MTTVRSMADQGWLVPSSHHHCRNVRCRLAPPYYRYQDDRYNEVTVEEFADRIALGLKIRDRAADHVSAEAGEYLKRMVDAEGHRFRDPTDAEAEQSKKRAPVIGGCWICKKHACKLTDYSRASWVCRALRHDPSAK